MINREQDPNVTQYANLLADRTTVVRLIARYEQENSPYLGLAGTIADLPSGTHRVSSGVGLKVARVKQDSGGVGLHTAGQPAHQ